MLSGVWNIYRKELVDTLRDRKTLIFMLLIPTAALPLLFAFLENLVRSTTEKQAIETVRIAASAEDQERYRRLVHLWFKDSPIAQGLRLAATPIVQSLVRPEALDAVREVPPEIFDDPRAFETWVRELASRAREGIETDVTRPEDLPDIDVPPEALEEVVDYYQVTMKGLGLIEFVEPASLDPAPGTFNPDAIPEDLRDVSYVDRAAAAIGAKQIHGFLKVSDPIEWLREGDDHTLELTLLHESTIRLSGEAYSRVETVARKAGQRLVQRRLAERDLGDSFLDPVNMRRGADLATESQIAFSFIGGVLPYFVIAFAFLGGMYPAIDLGAGEKERNTLETLILSPATRTEIAVGKFGVILTTALVAAFAGLLSIALSVKYIAPPELLSGLELRLPLSTGVLVALVAVPPAAAFAGLFLAISIYARSFKEAQNYIAPLQFVLILPALAPMLPGLELDLTMSLIPLVNVSMLSKELLTGTFNAAHYIATFASCFVLAAACIAYSIWQFNREEVLFRS